jgi:hypothetical protein
VETATLLSSSPTALAAALLPSSPTSAMAEGGAAARERVDHDTPLFFPICSGIQRCGGAWVWRLRCSSLLPQRHQQRRSSLLPQQGAPSSSGLYAITASSLLRIRTHRRFLWSYVTAMCVTLHWQRRSPSVRPWSGGAARSWPSVGPTSASSASGIDQRQARRRLRGRGALWRARRRSSPWVR